MPSPIVTASLQAALLSAISNLLAQWLASYQHASPLRIDPTPLLHFTVFALLSTPPNVLWQELLETWYPARVPARSMGKQGNPKDEGKGKGEGQGGETRLSKRNTAKKFALDQLLGAPVNTLMFLAAMGGFRGLRGALLSDYVKEEFMPLMVAGWKLWPAVGLLAFTLVPVERRVLFGGLVALGWNIYLGLVMAAA